MYVLYPDDFEAVPVRPENVVTYRLEDGSLSDLGPSLQVPKPTTLEEVSDQVYVTVLCKEVRHSLAPQAPCFFELHIQVPERVP